VPYSKGIYPTTLPSLSCTFCTFAGRQSCQDQSTVARPRQQYTDLSHLNLYDDCPNTKREVRSGVNNEASASGRLADGWKYVCMHVVPSQEWTPAMQVLSQSQSEMHTAVRRHYASIPLTTFTAFMTAESDSLPLRAGHGLKRQSCSRRRPKAVKPLLDDGMYVPYVVVASGLAHQPSKV